MIANSDIPLELQTYNLHALLHLHEDRIKFGPLSNVNAYGYENQLGLFKNVFLSKNRRIESLVRKIKTEKMLPIKVKNEKVKFIATSKVTEEHKSIIMHCSNIDQRQFEKIKFYEAFDWGFLKVACFDYTNRKNNCDSFIKLKNGYYYNVLKIYELEGEMMLLEKVLMFDLCPIIELSGLRTELTHIRPIRCLESKNYLVMPVDHIEKQICYVNLDQSLTNDFAYVQYLIDVEN